MYYSINAYPHLLQSKGDRNFTDPPCHPERAIVYERIVPSADDRRAWMRPATGINEKRIHMNVHAKYIDNYYHERAETLPFIQSAANGAGAPEFQEASLKTCTIKDFKIHATPVAYNALSYTFSQSSVASSMSYTSSCSCDTERQCNLSCQSFLQMKTTSVNSQNLNQSSDQHRYFSKEGRKQQGKLSRPPP
jgi:hypothetical protein